MFPIKKSPEISEKFLCESCNYKCSKQSEYNKHLLTNKHKILYFPTTNPIEKSPFSDNVKTYGCKCGKIYKHLSTLYAHRKKCVSQTIIEPTVKEPDIIEPTDKELIMILIKENSELKNMISEVIKNGTNNNNNINNNNNNNKTFNLQVFLNEQCKDAINISEFVDTIKMQLSDLETTGRLGYVEGVSRIINKNLNELETNKRPIHCSDVKRETLYIKDDNEWIKDCEEKGILKKAVKQIATKNIMQINEWKKANPDCTDSDSKKNNVYLNIVSNSMSGATKEEQFTNLNKIISKVTKEVAIDK